MMRSIRCLVVVLFSDTRCNVYAARVVESATLARRQAETKRLFIAFPLGSHVEQDIFDATPTDVRNKIFVKFHHGIMLHATLAFLGPRSLNATRQKLEVSRDKLHDIPPIHAQLRGFDSRKPDRGDGGTLRVTFVKNIHIEHLCLAILISLGEKLRFSRCFLGHVTLAKLRKDAPTGFATNFSKGKGSALKHVRWTIDRFNLFSSAGHGYSVEETYSLGRINTARGKSPEHPESNGAGRHEKRKTTKRIEERNDAEETRENEPNDAGMNDPGHFTFISPGKGQRSLDIERDEDDPSVSKAQRAKGGKGISLNGDGYEYYSSLSGTQQAQGKGKGKSAYGDEYYAHRRKR